MNSAGGIVFIAQAGKKSEGKLNVYSNVRRFSGACSVARI